MNYTVPTCEHGDMLAVIRPYVTVQPGGVKNEVIRYATFNHTVGREQVIITEFACAENTCDSTLPEETIELDFELDRHHSVLSGFLYTD